MGDVGQMVQNFSYVEWINSEDLMCSLVIDHIVSLKFDKVAAIATISLKRRLMQGGSMFKIKLYERQLPLFINFYWDRHIYLFI